MHWTPQSFLRHIAVKHGLDVYGLPEGCELRHPSKIYKLSDLQKLNTAWRSGAAGFRKMGGEEWAEVTKQYEATQMDKPSARTRVRGPSTSCGKRRDVRKVGTVGIKAKGIIRSSEFVVDSDVDVE